MSVDVNKYLGWRVDKVLAVEMPGLSRSKIQKLILSGELLINGAEVKPSYKLVDGDLVEVRNFKIDEEKLIHESLDLDIVCEDRDFLVINKEAGMVVHPGDAGVHVGGTVVNAVLKKLDKDLLFDKNNMRPGIVHRLDKETSGLLIIARNKNTEEELMELFKARKVKKCYLTIVEGDMLHKEGIIDSPIGRSVKDRKKMAVGGDKEAISIYKVLETFYVDERIFNLLRVEIKTGRTHQIRVHMAAMGNPVIGDEVYGNKAVNKYCLKRLNLKRHFLHAYYLRFASLKGRDVEFEIPLAKDLEEVLFELRNSSL